MKRSGKIFVIVVCVLLIISLVCIGMGIVLGGDFGGVINDIVVDLYARVQGTAIQVPDIQ